MQQPLLHIAFIIQELAVDVPAQQLMDRFLIGYPRDGEFHRPDCQIHVWLQPGADDSELVRRRGDFSLHRHNTIEDATASADAIVVVPRRIAAEELIEKTVKSARPPSAIFVYGALSQKAQEAQRLAKLATDRKIPLAVGTTMSVTWRLPQIDVPEGTRLTHALIVVQGAFPLAELHAIDALTPLLERRKRGKSGVRDVRHFTGQAVWDFAGPNPSSPRD